MSALMTDVIQGSVTPAVVNATCNAGRQLIEVAKLQYRYGTSVKGQSKVLELAVPLAE